MQDVLQLTDLPANFLTHNLVAALEYHLRQAEEAGESELADHATAALLHVRALHDVLCPRCND